MVIADVGEEKTVFMRRSIKQTGYSPQTLWRRFAAHGEVIGVLEYVNRIGEPRTNLLLPRDG